MSYSLSDLDKRPSFILVNSFYFLFSLFKIQYKPVRKHAASGDEAVDGVAHRSHQDTELVPPVDVLLLQAEDDGAQVLVVGEVVPVLGAVEIFLVGCLHHAGQLNRTKHLDENNLPLLELSDCNLTSKLPYLHQCSSMMDFFRLFGS